MELNQICKNLSDNYLLGYVSVLVVLPALLVFSNFFAYIYRVEITSYFYIYYDNPNLGFQIISFFQIAIFIVMLVIYPLYPSILYPKKYFKQKDPENVVTEYETLKKTVYILSPLFALAIGFMTVPRITGESALKYIGESPISAFILMCIGASFFVVGSALLRIVLLNIRREFRFYLAKMSITLISRKEDEVEQMRYLIMSLSSYNNYILRSIGLQINEIKRIYSKIVLDPDHDKDNIIMELSTAFQNKDKLSPLKCLSKLLNITNTEEFLIKQSKVRKLENLVTLLGTVVSIVTAIIGALTTLKFPGLS